MFSISKDGDATTSVGILFLCFATLKKINKSSLYLFRKSIVPQVAGDAHFIPTCPPAESGSYLLFLKHKRLLPRDRRA